jgi:hypothetical protein
MNGEQKSGDMNEISCMRSLGEEIYYATLITENEQQAKEMAIDETNKKWGRRWRPRQRMERKGSRV